VAHFKRNSLPPLSELRAALICLLTAALAEKGIAAIIGETEGGWFWLPPLSLWQPWAKEGLESATSRMALKVNSALPPHEGLLTYGP
jgi:hypothetical protein